MFDADEVDATVGAGGGGVFDADGAVVTEPDWAISVGDGIDYQTLSVAALRLAQDAETRIDDLAQRLTQLEKRNQQ